MESQFMVAAAARESSNLILLMLAMSFLILGTTAVKPWERLSEEEKMKLDLQLRIINKPALKSFQTEYGDILDCIDIHKQHAFDHPLLKNHTVQMKPKFIPKGMKVETSENEESSPLMLKGIQCPKGYVLIKRTTREDLLLAKHLSSLRITNPSNSHSSNNYPVDSRGVHSAVMEYEGVHYGAKANINVWSPSVSADQFTTASVWVSKSVPPQVIDIQAGAMVNPYLFKNYSRFYTYWSADGYQNTGCFNMLCPGFVQVSPAIPLGLIINPVSIYNGSQYQISLCIYQDKVTGYWWLAAYNQPIGYWPKSLLPNLSDGASYAAWGGQAYSPLEEGSPAMGSGHYPEEGFMKAAFMNELQVVAQSGSFVDPDPFILSVDRPKCYNIYHFVDTNPNTGHTIYYGGPGYCRYH